MQAAGKSPPRRLQVRISAASASAEAHQEEGLDGKAGGRTSASSLAAPCRPSPRADRTLTPANHFAPADASAGGGADNASADGEGKIMSPPLSPSQKGMRGGLSLDAMMGLTGEMVNASRQAKVAGQNPRRRTSFVSPIDASGQLGARMGILASVQAVDRTKIVDKEPYQVSAKRLTRERKRKREKRMELLKTIPTFQKLTPDQVAEAVDSFTEQVRTPTASCCPAPPWPCPVVPLLTRPAPGGARRRDHHRAGGDRRGVFHY